MSLNLDCAAVGIRDGRGTGRRSEWKRQARQWLYRTMHWFIRPQNPLLRELNRHGDSHRFGPRIDDLDLKTRRFGARDGGVFVISKGDHEGIEVPVMRPGSYAASQLEFS